jgi:hypothetical protein
VACTALIIHRVTMIHRPTDSRLLDNLLWHEKEYTKQLSTVLEHSQASLSSFSAYAAATPPPASQIILAVAGSIAGADEALNKYAAYVDEWREQLKHLKDLEEEVGNIMRDREILYGHAQCLSYCSSVHILSLYSGSRD